MLNCYVGNEIAADGVLIKTKILSFVFKKRRLIAVSVGCVSLYTCDRTQAKTRPKEIRPKCSEKTVQRFSTRWKRFPTRCNCFRMHWQRSTTRSKFGWATRSKTIQR